MTRGPWIYLDRDACDPSPSCMTCYFPKAELLCPSDREMAKSKETNKNSIYRKNGLIGLGCPSIKKDYNPGDIRAAVTEFLFGE